MTDAEARAVLVAALQQTANVFNDPAVSDRLRNPAGDVRIDELKLDSLDIVEWCLEIETQTGLSIDPAEVATATTLAEFSAVLSSKIAAGA